MLCEIWGLVWSRRGGSGPCARFWRRNGRRRVAFSLTLGLEDRIEAKKDYRQDVKKKWKDLQRAERRVDALLGPEEQVQWLGDLKSSQQIADELPVTVAFAVEDGSPNSWHARAHVRWGKWAQASYLTLYHGRPCSSLLQ